MPDGKSTSIQSDCSIPANRYVAIFLVSVWGLFLEMLLIRWIGAEVRIFAYLQNTVLVVCFLGLGLGCLTSRKPVTLRSMLMPLFFFLLLMAFPLTRKVLSGISDMLTVLGDVTIWANSYNADRVQSVLLAVLGLGLTFSIMVLVLEMFVPIGRLLGRLLDEHPNTIRAYSANVAGSLAGTWLFVLLSFLYLPPLTWFIVLAALTVSFFNWSGGAWKLNLALLLATVALSWVAGMSPGSREVVWSPYQKLVLWDMYRGNGMPEYNITVNNVGYQAMLSRREPAVPLKNISATFGMSGMTQYDIPFLFHPHPKSALILGAGSGNDVSGALGHGVESVTAVDIDPAIISLGRRYHPDRPYDSGSVRLVNDDARSFIATSRGKFDVVSFGLLDSHTETAMTNAPLDHYVYTRESITRARSLLADGGIMTLCFEAQKPFIADRMAGVLRSVFNEDPLSFCIPKNKYGYGGVMFVAGDLNNARAQITNNPRLAALIERFQRDYPVRLSYTTMTTTDDWPYIFLKTPGIPLLYYLLAAMTALLVVRSRKYFRGPGRAGWPGRESWHFFFLGAAFLLLEVQNISKASVILGNTWEVNAVIVTGVLVMILVANLLAARFKGMPMPLVYAALFAICLGLYFVDLARFASMPYAAKAVVVGGLTTMPMLFSGIIFIRSFAGAGEKDKALGANLVGALSGAMLQSLTFVTGIRALLLIVLALYILSVITGPALFMQRVKTHTADA